jgi:hypothetical protein
MPFSTENEMKSVAADTLPNSFGLQEEHIVSEFDYGKGRTDLVMVDISDDYWEHRTERLDLPFPISKKQHLISFLEIHGRGPVTEQFFIEKGAQPNHKKQESLRWMRDHHFIRTNNSGKIRTASNLRRHVTTTIAVELKLKKWKKALHQASMGRSFAEYRYVAIDEDHISRALENLEKFKRDNVGLISIDSTGESTTHWNPSRGTPYSNLYKWKINEASLGEITS